MLSKKMGSNGMPAWGAYATYDGLNVSYSPTDQTKDDLGNPIDIGTPHPDRHLCLLIRTPVSNTTVDLTAVTVGGVSLTQRCTHDDGYSKTYIWTGNVPTGTTANISYTVNSTTRSWDINGTIFAFYGDHTIQSTAGATDPTKTFYNLAVTAGETIAAFIAGSQGHSTNTTCAITSSSPNGTGAWTRISSNSSNTTVAESWVMQPEDVTTTTTGQTATVAYTGDATPQYSSMSAIAIRQA